VRIAVVGSGIAGLGAAHYLSGAHEVVLFEREARLGGHAHTHTLERDGRALQLDSGFIVYNERTYPSFLRLLGELGVRGQPSDMSFGVRCERCRLEYSSRGPGGLFAQPWRALDRGHLRTLADIPRFNRRARAFLAAGALGGADLGDFLDSGGYSRGFLRHFLLPMGGAVWSAPFAEVRGFPAASFLRFFDNHGWLTLRGAPRWWTVEGGSSAYVQAIGRRLGEGVRLATPVHAVRRDPAGVTVEAAGGVRERFDRVVLATHADVSLRLLADPAPEEARLLGSFRYSRNRTLLHTDDSALPRSRSAWASWNCRLADCRDEAAPVSITYHLNRLQSIPGPTQYCVSLNRDVRPGSVIAEMEYEHPILDAAAVRAQPVLDALGGTRLTHFCGAYLRNGFHEDGLVSALRVVERIGVAVRAA
jgi:predicted NAD/FAD-binding protein